MHSEEHSEDSISPILEARDNSLVPAARNSFPPPGMQSNVSPVSNELSGTPEADTAPREDDNPRCDSASIASTQFDAPSSRASAPEMNDCDALPEPANTTQLLSEDRSPPKTSTLSRILQDWWYLEILSMACSASSFAALVGVLLSYSGVPLQEWTGPVKINTAIALFSTLSKSAILMAASACIGQLKWQHFAQRPQRLSDLQSFDDASRGPWGACCLLLQPTRGSMLAMFTAAIVLLSLAIDPFAQQVVSFPSVLVSTANGSATIMKAQTYDSGAVAYGGLQTSAYTPIQMQGAIYRGIFGLRSDEMFYCPSADCDYPSFASLGVCSSCSDITEETERACYKYANGSGSPLVPADQVSRTAPMACNYTLPAGFNLWARSGMSGEGTFNTLVNATAGHADGANLMRMMILRFPELDSFDLPFGEVHDCRLDWCVRSYSNATVRAGVLQDADTTQYDLTLTKNIWFDTTSGGLETIWRISDAELSEYHFNDTFTINGADHMTTGFFLENLFTVAQMSYAANFNDPGRITIGYALQTAPDIPAAMESVARSVTQHIRSGPNSTMEYGETITAVPIIHVRWAWLMLPGGLVLCGCAALATSIFLTKKRNIALWKSSTLALVFHSIAQGEWSQAPGRLAALHSLSEMRSVADTLIAELQEVDGVTQLSLRVMTKEDEKADRS